MTIWLGVVTMLIPNSGRTPAGLYAHVRIRAISLLSACFVEFSGGPLICRYYWVYYVLPAYFDIRLS
jgi:hypothetical protein